MRDPPPSRAGPEPLTTLLSGDKKVFHPDSRHAGGLFLTRAQKAVKAICHPARGRPGLHSSISRADSAFQSGGDQARLWPLSGENKGGPMENA